jgi:hypothetical protein
MAHARCERIAITQTSRGKWGEASGRGKRTKMSTCGNGSSPTPGIGSSILMTEDLHTEPCRLLALPVQLLPLTAKRLQTPSLVGDLADNLRGGGGGASLKVTEPLFRLSDRSLHRSHPRKYRLLVAGKGHKVRRAAVRGEELLAGRAGFFCLGFARWSISFHFIRHTIPPRHHTCSKYRYEAAMVQP